MRKTSPPEGDDPIQVIQTVAHNAVRKAAQPKPAPKGPPPRKVPIRTCVACRTERQKRDLVRIVRTTEGEVTLDATGRMNGRGAYLCPNPECLKLAVKRRALDRSLGGSPSPESIAALEAEMAALEPASEGEMPPG
jgi:predicted RNA-binding protein YlxR (DUF448 family)